MTIIRQQGNRRIVNRDGLFVCQKRDEGFWHDCPPVGLQKYNLREIYGDDWQGFIKPHVPRHDDDSAFLEAG